MRKNIILALMAFAITFLIIQTVNLVTANKEKEIIINYYSQPDLSGAVKEIIELFENENPDIKVNLVELPENTEDKFETIKKAFQSGEMSVDVFDSDVVWPPIFASAGWVEPLDEYIDEQEEERFLKGPLEANRFMGSLWGIPYRIDSGMLYYRRDLLEKYERPIPKTWDELIETSSYIIEREGSHLYGFGASWDKFEGLTASALEFAWAYGGRVLLEDGKEIEIESKDFIEGIEKMVEIVNTPNMTHPDITTFRSGDARVIFNEGNQIFIRDWSSGWEISQNPEKSSVAGLVGISELPLGNSRGKNQTTLGGWQVMVSSFSKNKEAAIKFAKFRAGEEAQKIGAMKNSHLPSIKKLYNNPEINNAMPFLKYMYPSFENANPRPASPYYADISISIQSEVHKALLLEQSSEQAVKNMKESIELIMNTDGNK